jgi:hypothetical protein
MQNKKTLVIVVIAAVVLGALLYLGGLWQGRGQLVAERSTYTAQIQQLVDKLAVVETGNTLLNARIALYRAAADLDQRNFGMANSRLQEAARSLAALEPLRIDVDPARLEGLRREIASTSIAVALDFEQQRTRLLSLAWQLDQLTPGGAPPPAPVADAAPETAPFPAPPSGATPAPAAGNTPGQSTAPADTGAPQPPTAPRP